jgi:catechol 2,3-dioxygenase-like lactoylglutathione lyase family enzyme
MPSIPVRRLNHAVLYVRDVPRAVAFYREVLGMVPAHEDASFPGAAFLRAPDSPNDHDLGLFAIGPDAPGPVRGAVGLYHLAIQLDAPGRLLGRPHAGAHQFHQRHTAHAFHGSHLQSLTTICMA